MGTGGGATMCNPKYKIAYGMTFLLSLAILLLFNLLLTLYIYMNIKVR